LHILPTSRAIRARKQELASCNALLSKMVTIADFESRAVVFDGKLVDNMQRALFLKEASNLEEFNRLRVDRNLVKFYSQANDFFKFFQEVAYEKVEIKDIYYADSYAEFDKDLELLQKLLTRYKEIVQNRGFNDKIFLPKEYRLNREYLSGFEGFYLELDGLLTKYELELFESIAKIAPFVIKITTTEFNKKVIDSFRELGIGLEVGYDIEFSLSSKEILTKHKSNIELKSEVIKCSEHLEQIAIAFAKVEQMVESGIEPSKIALVVPDESIVPIIKSFDRLNNYNLAMGRAFREHFAYIVLKELLEFLKGSKIAQEFFARVQIDLEPLKSIKDKISLEEFFETLKNLKVPLFSSQELDKELQKLSLLQKIFKFKRVFSEYKFAFRDWLFLLLGELKEHTIDDVGGGKVTILGVLETRGSSFDGVVVVDFNDSIVPSPTNKDRFLNSAVRANAKLPTRYDRENLQKNYYLALLKRAKSSVIIYQENAEMAPSKFIDELGLGSPKEYIAPIEIFYNAQSNFNKIAHLQDEVVEFNPKEIVWSSSSLRTYLECKRKFFYRYYKKLQEPKSSEINDGLILHRVLANVLKSGIKYSSKDELKKAFLIELAKEEGPIELEFKKSLWSSMLDNFFEQEIIRQNQGWQIVSCEEYVSGEIAGLKFGGRIDRIDKKDNLLLVIDYKSGSTKALNSQKAENVVDFQMNIYNLLLQKPASTVDFAYIEILGNGKLDYLKAHSEKEKRLLEHIEYIKTQDKLEATRCENLQLCRNCAYRLLCHRGEYL
jgi:RecB family exonuclease